ncbi:MULTISPECIES: glycine--tRNA ligase subunit beta [Sphingomonas]|uniref:Glycine--tRNA ligase beta subunit n=3 Tax=Sphingomonas adhaesiva TaxID=28212 RepID=A0A2A4I9R3_9SPHN|nr:MULTISPECIES: glycine--tRNA ligase subunit beta [Sphingomonas]PCG15249.1 glycine--tRNA ligase subunit beta [Sphingomonas adhaesiva]PZU79294.1 MAG: glycine--tRNA ligase subunit beta [Sphingomonas sp.]
MTDFLLELRSEEIPARMQPKAREDLARLFAGELAKAGLTAAETVTYATPRRLALILRGLPDATQAVSEEVKGPKASAPPQALEGFLRKTGLTRDQLVERDGVLFAVNERPGRATPEVLAEAIPAVIRAFPWPKSMRWGAASASTESLRWVRPLQGIVALFGEAVVPVEVAGIASGAATVGHRFHHPDAVTIRSAADYVEALRDAHVIVDQNERAAIIATGAAMATAKAGLTLVRDEGLLAENAGLTEWPVPLLGRFDPDYLSVPPEVIQLTARVNQKYFVCRDADGKLANAFVCTANIDADDGGAKIVEGNRKVLAARLADARFFYDTDLKVPLEEQATKLDRIVFHEKLGTVADKVERVAKLARWLVEEGIILPGTGRGTSAAGGGGAPQALLPADAPLHHQPAAGGPPPRAGEDNVALLADQAERAARLAKADLVTGMVGEFPELQGLMGGYYAAAQGEDAAVANAIRDHYKPVGQGDDVPTDPVTVAVSLADKLDTIGAFFAIGERPTGSKDPFALRRAALGVLSLTQTNGLRLSLIDPLVQVSTAALIGFMTRGAQSSVASAARSIVSMREAGAKVDGATREIIDAIRPMVQEVTKGASSQIAENLILTLDFFADRLKVQQREAGVRHDLIDAVFALGGEDDLVRLLARVHALQAFVATDDGANLLAGYKRAANILKKEGMTADVTPVKAGVSDEGAGQEPREAPASAGATYDREPAEAALVAALDAAEPAAADAVAREDFAGAMAALATLRAPIDAFFDAVTVNDADPAKRAARLALLARVRDAVHGVADFSRIEG